ncbi:hypothetical protein [Acinetobacter pragensis]|uniref:Uncharacterized protein n=1 Tax=Acinetobacter pragensis TaxID=1806892 RepID=A0A151Y5C7_9GAMM|nr:hypothetical protein [Acinetobacter pragensis]KYQ73206.1 hypothetical protein AZH43_07200 [Acinetobacter pragensis]
MKTKLIIALLLAISITGCQKQQAEDPKTHAAAETQFKKSDIIIGSYLDKLDSPNTSKAEQINIICKDYPTEYKTNYMPSLLKLQPNDYTEAQLLKDLDIALNYYKEKLSITCE